MNDFVTEMSDLLSEIHMEMCNTYESQKRAAALLKRAMRLVSDARKIIPKAQVRVEGE